MAPLCGSAWATSLRNEALTWPVAVGDGLVELAIDLRPPGLLLPPDGVTTTSLGFVSLKGAPMKPHTTPVAFPGRGISVEDAWIWAFVRLSVASLGVCNPVKSMLLIVALNDKEVNASLYANVAVP